MDLEQRMFVKCNRVVPSIHIKITKGRIRFEHKMTDNLVMSGPFSSKT
jgi:hypothetical protein